MTDTEAGRETISDWLSYKMMWKNKLSVNIGIKNKNKFAETNQKAGLSFRK